MLSQHLITLAACLSSAAAICIANESVELRCNAGPQDMVDVADFRFLAESLRAHGKTYRAGRLFSMTAADAPDCEEWLLDSHGSAMVVVKHVGGAGVNTSVLFADIATTIDGGEQQAESRVDCGLAGGSSGVVVNATHPTYKAAAYPAGHSPEGVMVKIMAWEPGWDWSHMVCYWHTPCYCRGGVC